MIRFFARAIALAAPVAAALAGAIIAAFSLAAPAALAQERVFERVWRAEGLATPESVVYAPALDAFLVANINGGNATAKDADGYIARLSLDGAVDETPFATGLNAPKGMAVTDTRLFVADIDELVEIDLADGAILARYPYPEARFLNDVTIAPDGIVHVSDTRRGEILALMDGALSVWAEGADLARVNGLLAEDDRLLALAGDRLLALDWESREITEIASGFGAGDGIAPDGRGGYVTTQWGGRIFHVAPDGAVTTVSDTRLLGVNTADPAFAPDAGLFAVPTFYSDGVLAFRFAE